jgi:hypothetical protein
MRKKGPDPFSLAAGAGLALVLIVVIAAAGIRLDTGIPGLRVVHRVAASLEVLVVLWLAWLDWRRPAVLLAIALTVLLSIVGILAGQNPPPAAAAANLLGGLALAAIFAWLLGVANHGAARIAGPALVAVAGVLLAIQLSLGAGVAIVERFFVALPAHAILALALSGFLGWLGLARTRGSAGSALFGVALAAPLAGFTALHYENSAGAALVHAVAAAGLVAAAAYALGRGA